MQSRRVQPLPPLDLHQRYTIDEATIYLRQSRSKTYQDIKEGRLESFTDGRRRYVPGRAIAARSDLHDDADAELAERNLVSGVAAGAAR